MSFRAILLIAITAFAAPRVTATTHTVDPGESIQAAIGAATAGDTISVAPGTYPGNLDYLGKALVLTAAGGPEATIIQGDGTGSVVTMTGITAGAAHLRGFTVTGGGGTSEGGGIRIIGGTVRIVRCIIRDNDAGGRGGGLLADGMDDLQIVNCRILGNHSSGTGGGIEIGTSGSACLVNCAVTGNTAFWGGGIFAFDGSTVCVRFTSFAGNGSASGSAIHSYTGTYGADSNVLVRFCILWDNPAGDSQPFAGPGSATSSCIEGGYPGYGNFADDPLFAAADGADDVYGTLDDDLRLLAGSAALDLLEHPEIDDGTDLDGDGDTTELLPLDLDDNPRTMAAVAGAVLRVDLGPYERWADCNSNGVPDLVDIRDGSSTDRDGNNLPDECDPDCNANGVADHIDIADGSSFDCDRNGVPDECDVDSDGNGNGVPDVCENIHNVEEDTWHARIQWGLEHARNGNRITLAPGTYYERINFLGKSVRLEGLEGPEATIIDGQSAGNVVTCTTGESGETVLRGLTIRNGRVTSTPGGGIYCVNSSPTVVDCRIVDNSSTFAWGGVYLENSTAHFINCAITDNLGNITQTDLYTGGVYALGGAPLLDNCTVYTPTWDMPSLEGDGGTITARNTIIGTGIRGSVATSHVYWSTSGLVRFDYHLEPDSPCIDAGSAALLPADFLDLDGDGDLNEPWPYDIDGQRRVIGGGGSYPGALDIGCDEFSDGVSSVDPGSAIPGSVRLAGISPNPFNPRVTVMLAIPPEGADVEVAVYDLRGRRLATIASRRFETGTRTVVWDGRDDQGRRLASGTYFIRVRSGAVTESRKVLLLE